MPSKRFIIPFIFLAVGCSSHGIVKDTDSKIVTTSEFSHGFKLDVSQVNTIEEKELSDTTLSTEIRDVASVEPTNSEFEPTRIGIPITVEALVGQVNGRPVYANVVLEPLSDQLDANATRLSRSAFYDSLVPPQSTPLNSITSLALYFEVENMGTSLVGGRMYDLVKNDLLLSEARSGMTREQEYGLFAVIGQMRSDLASAQGGSQSKMRQDIEQHSGVSVERFLEFQRDLILIEALDRQKIWPKVNVTWRDIQREFEQISLGEFIPADDSDDARTDAVLLGLQKGMPLGSIEAAKGSATIEKIQLSLDDPKVEEVKQGFASGLSFTDVVELVQIPAVERGNGYWRKTFEMGMGGVAEIDVADLIKDKLVDAKVGEVLPPTQLRTTMLWVSIAQKQKPISLYNRRIQIALRNALRWVQFNREKNRFVQSLWGDGSIHEVKAMAERVANIAVRRHHR